MRLLLPNTHIDRTGSIMVIIDMALDNLGLPVLISGADGSILYANSAFKVLVGATEVLGRHIEELLLLIAGHEQLAEALAARSSAVVELVSRLDAAHACSAIPGIPT